MTLFAWQSLMALGWQGEREGGALSLEGRGGRRDWDCWTDAQMHWDRRRSPSQKLRLHCRIWWTLVEVLAMLFLIWVPLSHICGYFLPYYSDFMLVGKKKGFHIWQVNIHEVGKMHCCIFETVVAEWHSNIVIVVTVSEHFRNNSS